MGLDNLQYEEVDFEKTGLEIVICQLRFDPLLRIAHEPPLHFQEALRSKFPRLTQRREAIQVQVATGSAAIQPTEAPQTEPSVWLMHTEQGDWTAALGASYVSLETVAYKHFASFSAQLDVVLDAFEEAYPGIDTFRRVGLRYVNVFTEEEFPGRDWVTRLKPQLTGPMADSQIGDSVVSAQQQFVLAESDWTITVRHGSEGDGGYRLDLDHATRVPVSYADVRERLSEFNGRIYQVFRWAISEEMLYDMGPGPRT